MRTSGSRVYSPLRKEYGESKGKKDELEDLLPGKVRVVEIRN